jgi:hypothetical protein
MLKLAINVVLPAVGIFLAALIQLAVNTLWPALKFVPFLYFSIDSYLLVSLAAGFCFVAGGLAQRSVPTVAGAASAVIVPLAWLALWLKVIVTGGASTVAWLRPVTLFTIFTALLPLIGVALGWATSSSRGRSVAEAA